MSRSRLGGDMVLSSTFDFDGILCNTSYEATQRVVSAQVDELIRCVLLFLGGLLLLA